MKSHHMNLNGAAIHVAVLCYVSPNALLLELFHVVVGRVICMSQTQPERPDMHTTATQGMNLQNDTLIKTIVALTNTDITKIDRET